jgi:hypothetical protein
MISRFEANLVYRIGGTGQVKSFGLEEIEHGEH